MGVLFARTIVSRDEQQRLGALGAFDLAVSHLRDAIVQSHHRHPGRPFSVALEYQDEPGGRTAELTGRLPGG